MTMTAQQKELLQAIRQRQKSTRFGEGIVTGDRYTKSVLDCCGSRICYKYGTKDRVSWDDVMRKAARTLTYNNPEMILEEKYTSTSKIPDLDGIELPKNTLIVFRHILTTSRKDRDGDILRTKGASVDPKMLLLWNHAHTLPIGKMIKVHDHASNRLTLISAVVDINELAHDAVVMIENKMGRFSHGFRAIEFEKTKAERGNPGGFDIKEFEIMEESLVTVPSNVDAEVEEVIYSLVSGKQLKSPLMKGMAEAIKEKRGVTVNVPDYPISIDLNVKVVGAKEDDKKKEAAGTKCSCGGKPESERVEEDDKAAGSEDTEDDEMMEEEECPKCGAPMKDGKCTKCGYSVEKSQDSKGMECPECGGPMKDGVCTKCGYTEGKKGDKAGRVISGRNIEKLKKAYDHMSAIHDREHLMTMDGKKRCKEAMGHVKEVMDTSGGDVEPDKSVQESMANFLSKANRRDRKKMLDALKSMESVDQRSETTELLFG